jgi:hypothetical protein
MAALAASLPLKALNRVDFRLYEKFVPDVLKGAEGGDAKGVLHLEHSQRTHRSLLTVGRSIRRRPPTQRPAFEDDLLITAFRDQAERLENGLNVCSYRRPVIV